MFFRTKEGRIAYLTYIQNLSSHVVLLTAWFFIPKLLTFHITDGVHLWLWILIGILVAGAMIANVVELITATKVEIISLLIALLASFIGLILLFLAATLPRN